MRRILSLIALCALPAGVSVTGVIPVPVAEQQHYMQYVQNLRDRMHTRFFNNGLGVVVLPYTDTNIVKVGVYIGVGSSDERFDERGMAHIVEHMGFKQTATRDEFYVRRLMEHIGAVTNANTSKDRTFFYIDGNIANWKICADVLADSMQNLVIDPVSLQSELSAILQEVKVRNSDVQDLGVSDFYPANHSHAGHPIIGFKEQFMQYTAADLTSFYRKYYRPDNMMVVVAGAADPEEVFAYVESVFNSFPQADMSAPLPVRDHELDPFFCGFTNVSKRVHITQNKQKRSVYWRGPQLGSVEQVALGYVLSALERRLRHQWVDSENKCLSVSSGMMAIGKEVLLKVAYQLKEHESLDNPAFAQDLARELASLASDGVTDDEYVMCFHATQYKELFPALEDPQTAFHTLSFALDRSRSLSCFFAELEQLLTVDNELIKRVAAEYVRPFLMNSEDQVPLPQEEMGAWQALQARAAQHDALLVEKYSKRIDTGTQPSYSDVTRLPERPVLPLPEVPSFSVLTLSNGLQVWYLRHATVPKVACSLVLNNAENWATSLAQQNKDQALSFWNQMLVEGPEGLTKKEFDDALAVRGVSFAASPYSLSFACLADEFEYALSTISRLMASPALPQEILDRCKMHLQAVAFYNQNHPIFLLNQYLISSLIKPVRPWTQTIEEQIMQGFAATRDDVYAIHSLFCDPRFVSLVVCGDIEEQALKDMLESYLVPVINRKASFEYSEGQAPAIAGIASGHIEAPISTAYVLARGFTSFDRDHVLYPAYLLLGDYINQQIFALREQTGLFYSSQGAVIPATQTTQAGLIGVAATSSENVCNLADALYNLFLRMHEQEITEEFLAILKKEQALKRSTYLNTAETLNALAAGVRAGGTDLSYENNLALRMQDVALDQFQEVVSTCLDPANLSFITIGSAATIGLPVAQS